MNLESSRLTRYRETPEHQERDEARERHLRMYAHAAEIKGIKPVTAGVWFKADGVQYTHLGDETVRRVETNSDGEIIPPSRLDAVGTFDANNGLFAYVDEQGQLWVGRTTGENANALWEARYRPGALSVPFSDQQRILSADDKHAFLDARTGKSREVLAQERAEATRHIQALYTELFGARAATPDAETIVAELRERPQLPDVTTYVREQLKPTLETDDETNSSVHHIYHVGKNSFALQQKEQMPRYPTSRNAHSELCGAQFQLSDAAVVEQYTQTLRGDDLETDSHHYHVVGSVQGIVECAHRLTPDPELGTLANEMRGRQFSARALKLADAYIATKYIPYGHLGKEPELHAEACMILALSGDATAQRIVIQRLLTLERHDKEKKIEHGREVDAEPLRTDELIVTHATRYMPTRTADGLSVPTSFDATDGRTVRNTVHTALNHRVAGHAYGSWDSANYTILSPLQEMITHNGLPRALNTVDTYWTRNPGEQLLFPHAVFVGPGEANQTELIHEHDRGVFFKAHPTAADVPAILVLAAKQRETNKISYNLGNAFWNSYADEVPTLEHARR